MNRFKSKVVTKCWSQASHLPWITLSRKTSTRFSARHKKWSRPESQATRPAWCSPLASQWMEMYSCLLRLIYWTIGSRTSLKITEKCSLILAVSGHSKIMCGRNCGTTCKMTLSRARMWVLKVVPISRWASLTLKNLRALANSRYGSRSGKRQRLPRQASLNRLTLKGIRKSDLARYNSIHLETAFKTNWRNQSLITTRPMQRHVKDRPGKAIAETWLFIIRSISQRKRSRSSRRGSSATNYTCLMSLLCT